MQVDVNTLVKVRDKALEEKAEQEKKEKEQKDKEKAVTIDGIDVVDGSGSEVYDRYDENYIATIVRQTPETRFRHRRHFTDDEQKIIAAGLVSETTITKIAQSIHCTRSVLKAYIESDPILNHILQEQKDIEKDRIREAVKDCIDARVPAVIMWAAQHKLADEYGDEKPAADEDETRLVFGDISDEDLARGDAILADAAAKPIDVGLSALADPQVLAQDPLSDEMTKELVRAGAEVSPLPLAQTLPAPALNPGNDPNFVQIVPPSVPSSPSATDASQPPRTVAASATDAVQPPSTPSPPRTVAASATGAVQPPPTTFPNRTVSASATGADQPPPTPSPNRTVAASATGAVQPFTVPLPVQPQGQFGLGGDFDAEYDPYGGSGDWI